jgi:hypothetical protein
MKSAYELAMERLEKKAPTKKLSEKQKERIAEINSLYGSRIAERDFSPRRNREGKNEGRRDCRGSNPRSAFARSPAPARRMGGKESRHSR